MTATQLTQVADGVWIARQDIFYGARAFHFATTMTVLRLGQDALLLHSPVTIDPALAVELETLGRVAFIVAPNAFHHLFAEAALDRYPDAQLLISPALATKRPRLTARAVVLDVAADAWGDELWVELFAGLPTLGECVLYHRASRTLVVTDLIFNIHETRGWMMPVVLRLIGAWRQPAQTRTTRALVRDRQAAHASAQRIIAWEPQRVIVAHGHIIESDAPAVLRACWSWLEG